MKQRLRQALSQRHKQHIVNANLVRSAVIIPIYDKQGQYYILFTKRTQEVKDHKGQISFPGGAYQEEDGTLVNTALRECAEEIGLMPGDVEILGELDDFVTQVSNYIISPFVGLIPWPYQFKMNEEEIEEILNSKKQEISEEMADILFFILRLAQKYDINLTDEIDKKLEKNNEKYPIEKAKGSNKKYNEL